jgi:DNA-binding transcriptional LysR family regulator
MLDLRNLRYLVTLARHLNYVRAADELAITQPTLSRAIQALERQLAVRLFDRDRGGVHLTPQGRDIAERAAFLLADAEELERRSHRNAQGESGHVRFGMAPMPARALLAKTLADRLNAAPRVTNEVVVRDVEALWSMLVRGEIEFFVSPYRPGHDLTQARIQTLGRFPLSLIVRAGHPLLADPGSGERFPLLRSSWTGLSVPAEVRHFILDDPNIVEDFGTLARITATTDAIWLSSAYAIEDEIRAGMLVELFRAADTVEVAEYALTRRSRSALADALVAALKHHAGQAGR